MDGREDRGGMLPERFRLGGDASEAFQAKKYSREVCSGGD